MSDAVPDLSIDANPQGVPNALQQTIANLERRVQALESSVATLTDTTPLEERIVERVKAQVPPPTSSGPPSFRDISLPIPSVDSLVTTAKTTWTILEMLNELKLLLWMLIDRRYHMGWVTRVVSLTLLFAILTSGLWLPFAFDNIFGRLWEKFVNLILGFVMFFIVHFELRRYREWLRR